MDTTLVEMRREAERLREQLAADADRIRTDLRQELERICPPPLDPGEADVEPVVRRLRR